MGDVHGGDGPGEGAIDLPGGAPGASSPPSSAGDGGEENELLWDAIWHVAFYGSPILLYLWLLGVSRLFLQGNVFFSRVLLISVLSAGLGTYFVGLRTEQFAARRWAAADQLWALETLQGIDASDLPPHPLDDLSRRTRQVLMDLSLYAKTVGPFFLLAAVGSIVFSIVDQDPVRGVLAVLLGSLFVGGVMALRRRGSIFVRLPDAIERDRKRIK